MKHFRPFALLPLFAALILTPALGLERLHEVGIDGTSVQAYVPKPLKAWISHDGKTAVSALPPTILLADPNPSPVFVRIPPPAKIRTHDGATSAMAVWKHDAPTASPQASTSLSFFIEFVASGGQDLWGEPCYSFPAEATTVFNAAVGIWGGILESSVPVGIRACWAQFPGNTLGYAGGGTLHRDFSGAPQADTWYMASLANALAGRDLNPSSAEIHITFNGNFAWYYGIDGNTPQAQTDLLTVVLHEMAHGLGFTGSMAYASGSAKWGASGYPFVYDRFMRDGSGNQLINTAVYPNPSYALGHAVTSGDIWHHGPRAMAANGGPRVKMYAPFTWSEGSSYSHLDFDTFRNTSNGLMVYALASGVSIRHPGDIAIGLLEDLGWQTAHTSLFSGQLITGLAGSSGSQRFFYIDVPPDSANLTVKISGGTGDADLYLRFDDEPTLLSYDCRPYTPDNQETCVIDDPVPGRYFVMLHGFSAYSGLSLTAAYTPAPPPQGVLPAGTWVTASGSIADSSGTPLCAMILINGQYTFSCTQWGEYQLIFPLDPDGRATMYVFVDGLAPFRSIFAPGKTSVIRNAVVGRAFDVPSPVVEVTVLTTNPAGNTATLGGFVTDVGGVPLCAMVLANGQYMFSCAGQGAFDLTVPRDVDGSITLYVFVDSMAPYRQIIHP